MKRVCVRCGQEMPLVSTNEVVRLTGRFAWAGAVVFVVSLFFSGNLWFVVPATLVAVAWAGRGSRAKDTVLCRKCCEQGQVNSNVDSAPKQ